MRQFIIISTFLLSFFLVTLVPKVFAQTGGATGSWGGAGQPDGSPCSVATECSSGVCGGGSPIGGSTCQAANTGIQTGSGGMNNPVQTGSGGGVVPNGPGVSLINPLNMGDCSTGNGKCLETFLGNILAFVVRIGAIVVVLMLVYVGFLFVVAQGNESKLTEARRALLWTVVGALILLGAQAISMGIMATVQALGG